MKTAKKLVLAKETLRGLEKRDDLRHVAGGTLVFEDRMGTVVTGCNLCTTDISEGSCCTCVSCPC